MTGEDIGGKTLEIARADSERGEVVLRRRTTDLGADVIELRVNGVFTTDTHETAAGIEHAAAALELVPDPRDVVVAGLGLGFTTQRMLADPRVELLNPGGALVIWSAAAAPELLAGMRSVFGDAAEQAHDVLHQDRPESCYLYSARQADSR